MQNITVLGATGSIGDSTFAVIRQHKHLYSVFAISGYSNIVKLESLCKEFLPKYVAVATLENKKFLTSRLSLTCSTEILVGHESLNFIAKHEAVDIVVAAIVGIAGLSSVYTAAISGKKILLANKESLVAAGHIIIDAVKNNNATLIPIDSEHNAIFQVLPEHNKYYNADSIDKIILTASGGPFLSKKMDELINIAPEDACKHPNWHMGKKISIDSSTMVNKALEVIEAYWLFNVPADHLEVLIHPQSIVHSMVCYQDGSYLAQMGQPNMSIPIAYGIFYPERCHINSQRLDFSQLNLTFSTLDLKRFPVVEMVFNNLHNKNYNANIVFNAANEVLVSAFLERKINYLDIYRLLHKIMEVVIPHQANTIEDVYIIDKWARKQIHIMILAS